MRVSQAWSRRRFEGIEGKKDAPTYFCFLPPFLSFRFTNLASSLSFGVPTDANDCLPSACFLSRLLRSGSSA